MNLEWYYTFIKMAQCQNYRQAAEDLYITQSTAFKHIRNLETFLNVKLFEQYGRNIRLTDAGKSFRFVAENTINTFESEICEFKHSPVSNSYKIRLVVSTYIASYLLSKFLEDFFVMAPNIEISVSVQDDGIPESILDDTFDIGISRKMPTNRSVNYKNVCEGSIRLIVPNVPENKYLQTETDYFRKYRVITDNHPVYWAALKEQITAKYQNAEMISITSVNATQSLIKANQGVSYLPLYIFRQEMDKAATLENTHYKVIESQEIPAPISYTYLIWVKKKPEITRFLKMFEKYIRKEQV